MTPSDSSHGLLQWRPKCRGNLTRSKSAGLPTSLYNHSPLAKCPSWPHLTHSTPAVASVLLGLGIVGFARLRPSFWLRIGQAAYIRQVTESIRDTGKASPPWTREHTVGPMSRLFALFGSSFRKKDCQCDHVALTWKHSPVCGLPALCVLAFSGTVPPAASVPLSHSK